MFTSFTLHVPNSSTEFVFFAQRNRQATKVDQRQNHFHLKGVVCEVQNVWKVVDIQLLRQQFR